MMAKQMTEWKQIARLRGSKLPDEDLDAVSGTLEALERKFRALEGDVRLETEPANFYVVPAPEEEA